MARFKFVLWLAYWYLQSKAFEFEWDKGNLSKSASKHGVSADEVESVFELKLAAPIGEQILPSVPEERLCLVGPSASGRMVSVVFTLREGRVRPISSRMASRKERREYDKIRKALKGI
jgi:uncharacterized protein